MEIDALVSFVTVASRKVHSSQLCLLCWMLLPCFQAVLRGHAGLCVTLRSKQLGIQVVNLASALLALSHIGDFCSPKIIIDRS